jgi:hypothetical protein
MKLRITACLWIICLLLLSVTGCKKPCKDITCVNGACMEGTCLCNDGWTGPNCDQADECYARNCNNGYCADGACVCDPLWEGNNCSSPINQKFIGNWAVDETCSASGQGGYSIIISGILDKLDKFRIANFYATGVAEGKVNADRLSFSVPLQSIAFGYDVEATSAAIDANSETITISYTVYAQGTSTVIETCSATWTKY